MLASVSVVINTYNRARTLEATLAAMAWQRHPRFEVIVVNGPSTDGTEDLLAHFAGKIRTARCTEANLSMSRNIGLAMAAGEIVAYIDDDAVPEPDWLEAIAAPYADPQVGAVGGFIRDHTGYAWQCRVVACDRYGDNEGFETVEQALQAGVADRGPGAPRFLSPTGANSSFRRGALLGIGGFDEEFAYFLDETDVAVRLLDAGWAIAYAARAEVHHKYADSHLRRADRIPRSIFVPARSKSYFCIRHAVPHDGFAKVVGYLARYRRDRRRDKEWLFDNGLIDRAHFDRLVSEIDRGSEAGVADGFRFPDGRLPDHRPGAPPTGTAKPALELLHFRVARPAEARLRICFVSQDYPPGPVGGIAVWTHTIATTLAARGHEISVVTRGEGYPRVDFEQGVWVHRIPQRHHPGRDAPALPDLSGLIADWAYSVHDEVLRIRARRGLDLVSAPIWDVEGVACLADGTLPVVTSLHSTYKLVLPSKRKWQEDATYRRLHVDKLIAAEAWMLDRSQMIFANSEAILRDIEASYGIVLDRARVRLVPHGLPPEAPAAPAPRGHGCRILYVGRFETRKGIDVLAKAIPAVLAAQPEARFVLAGDPDVDEDGRGPTHRGRIEALVAQHPGRVEMTGVLSRDALVAEYARADVFVAPSRYESFGLIFLEAMMQGVACVGTRAGGIPEVIEDGVTGLLVPPEDPAALAAALIRLAGDGALRRRLGEAGLAAYHQRFTAERMAEIAEAAYREAKRAGPARRRPPEMAAEAAPADAPDMLAWRAQARSAEEVWAPRFRDDRPPLRPVIVGRDGDWVAEPGVPHHHGAALRSICAGDRLRIRFPAAREASLLLLRHGWSGSAEVAQGEVRARHALHREETDLLEIPLPGLAPGGEVEVLNTGRVKGSRDEQVWLIGYRCDGVLWPVELGQPVSRAIRLIEGKVGNFLAFRTDIGVAEVLALHGVWGADEVAVFAEHLRPGMNVVDVGANIGHHSVAMARLVAPGGRILCVEPQAEVNRLLEANLALNGIAGARSLRCLVGEGAGEAKLSPISYEAAGNFGAVDVARCESDGESVAMTTLDALVAEQFGDAPVHFVKLDVQSFELFVLRGAADLLHRCRPLVYLEISPYWMKLRGYDYREIYALFERLGYTWRNLLHSPSATQDVPAWDGETDIEWNMLALPPGYRSAPPP